MNHFHAFTVRLHDVDAAGVMFFARLFVHAHDAYEDFMARQSLELEKLIGAGTRLPLVHASADYLLPLRHGERVSVALEVEKLGRTSFTVAYALRCGDELRARLQTVHVFLAGQGGVPSPLPEEIRQRLLPYSLQVLRQSTDHDIS